MDRTRLTFVTVFFETELPLLLLQARSMSKHLDKESVSKVYIIDNCDNPITEGDRQAILIEYGHHAESVRFVLIDELGITRKNTGYVRQQLAKLMISGLVEAPWYITLDAKNLFVSSRISGFLESKGLPTISRYSFKQHPLRKKLELSLSYLGVSQAAHLENFTPTVTPFSIYTNIAQDLLKEVAQTSGRDFEDEFVSRGLTEFFLYGAWMVKRRFNVDELYSIVDQLPNVWPKMVNMGGVDRALEAACATNAPIFTVHRKALARIDKVNLERIATFWVDRQIFATSADAIMFVDQIKSAVEARSKSQTKPAIMTRAKRKAQLKIHSLLRRFNGA